MAEEPVIAVQDLVQRFADRAVLDGISFQVRRGEILVIMGGSGCGKSTLLRALIGSLRPTSGSISLLGEDITRLDAAGLDRMRQKIGVLFQSGALFNSLTLGENIALPLQEHTDLAPDVVEIMVKMKLEMVGLRDFEHLKPAQISGGMKKRVGLARALALDPELMFYDEPSAGLDPVASAMIDELMMDLNRKTGVTSIVVTHDMGSAFKIAHRMILLFRGKVVAEGTPAQIRAAPDPLVRQFINGLADGPIPMRVSKKDYVDDLLGLGSDILEERRL
ncbi:MAG: ABC transporter ATP-binding protein [Elusimicrobia bacterium]|nr:ABC transporter ATP-binding protein [Elusimicrobiota bacterium]